MPKHKIRKWWEKPLRISGIYLPLHGSASVAEKLNPAKIVEVKKGLHFNTEHQDVTALIGGEQGIFYFQSDAASKTRRDFLKQYLPEAHKKGIKVLIYLNVHWLSKELYKKHPNWVQVTKDDKPVPVGYGGSGYLNCVNSPWRDWSFQVIHDLLKYDIQGIFLDGPYLYSSLGACYCQSCRSKFRKLYGRDIPQKLDLEHPLRRQFIQFQADSIIKYIQEVRRLLKAKNPEVVLYMNGIPPWMDQGAIKKLVASQDLVGQEGGCIFYVPPNNVPVWKPGKTAKLLETRAKGKPTVVFISGLHLPWSRYILTPTEIKLLFAETVANGANPWFSVFWEEMGKPGVKAAGEMNQFLEENEDYYENTVSLAEIGLIWSVQTSNYYTTDIVESDFSQDEKIKKKGAFGNFSRAFAGWYEILMREHIPFDVIDETTLVDIQSLRKYKLLIMPNCACISKKIVKMLKQYVRDGGNLIATFDTSLYDEYGKRQKDLQLKDVFGANFKGDFIGPVNFGYVHLNKGDFATAGLTQYEIPSPAYQMGVSPTTAKILAVFRKKVECRYSSLPPLTNNPAILFNKFGKGKSVYLPGTFDAHYETYKIPEHQKIFANIVNCLCKPFVELENAFQTVEVILRYQPERHRLLVHLINYTGEMTRPIQKVIPCENIQITIRAADCANYAQALMLNKNIPISKENGEITFTVPIVKEYEVIAIKIKNI